MTNIAEILKNAQQKLKLYSPLFGDVYVNKIINNGIYRIQITDTNKDMRWFMQDGRYINHLDEAECLLFPSKEHKSWDNWQEVLFQVGDVVTSTETENTFIIIFKNDVGFNGIDKSNLCHKLWYKNYRYATPEEREQFFNELNRNGYTWNDNTKQMEKSLQQYTPKYKVGDYIVGDDETIYKIMDIHSALYTLYDYRNQNKFKQMIKKIDENYSLVTDKELIDAGIKNQHHKFKAGDVIRNKETGTVRRISYLDTNRYILYQYNDEGMTGLSYENEDKWEVVTEPKSESHYATPHREFFNWIFDRLVNVHGENPNFDYMLSLKERIDDLFPETEETDTTSEPTEEKPFTIDDFKPFDKVLVKYRTGSKWGIELFERYDNDSINYPYICLHSVGKYCIPYNDETKHLLGTTDDYKGKYKTWEE